MLQLEPLKQSAHNYYSQMPCGEDDFTVNSIRQFAFSDTELVPELFRNFAVEYFKLDRFRRVDLDELNRVLNELWDGPGSAAKISDMYWDLRLARRAELEGKETDVLKGYETPTVDSNLEVESDSLDDGTV